MTPKPHCQNCKKKDVILMVLSKYKGKISSSICRSCNTKRARKYRKTKAGIANIRKAISKSYINNKDKQYARMNFNYHVRKGLINKPDKCKCGNKKVEAHHADYTKPLKVKWLCRTCHADLHRRLKSKKVV